MFSLFPIRRATRPVTSAAKRWAAWAGEVMLLAAPGCWFDPEPAAPSTGVDESALVQTCTAQNIAGWPYSGVVCGGSVIDGCSKGALYSCQGGSRGATNNCTLSQSCATGCLTGTSSTPVTLNTSSPRASDACYTGAAPLTLSTGSAIGGDYVTMTGTLSQSHNSSPIVNLQGTTSSVPPLCDVPVMIPSGASSVSWIEPTGVVTQAASVPLNVLISFQDSAGRARNLVSVPTVLTLAPGGSVPLPPLASFKITNSAGTETSIFQGGTNALVDATVSLPAPVGGVNVMVTSSPTSAFVTTGSFGILTGCKSIGTLGFLTATSAATSNLAATITATTGAGAAFTKTVTVTPPALAIQAVTLTPSTVKGGTSATVAVSLNRSVLASDASSTVSVRLSEGLITGTPHATFPGCTGSPACTGPLTVAVGAASASLAISTQPVASEDQITVSASAAWSNSSASRNLTITP